MVYISRNVSNTDRGLNIGSFLKNLSKFAVDSAINVSLKGFTGGKKLYQTFLHEKLKDEPSNVKLMKKEEETQSTKMEDTANKAVGGTEPVKKKKKMVPEDLKEMELEDPKRKTIFIRSRL
ncbi:von Willebrand factor A domain-containing 2 [Gossypium arboreum]|uniref:von Willebrand factor A domain-containing 2 n=2 Tax=Gossypium arboreum TaxID=29729 RepID=A0A0B0NJN3_GOSAR|nr:uncharacterized protein LOC108472760 [Gossypium arboreum]KAK5786719.1 hypothetical protein PVK06_041362 [Gossypium arboreum]KHG10706.1 von Willebrand factor A domain-containing 2 [Gossypium arboreum]KHG13070.1 von Willebrand factor A domain-containing 2 [Gossypium arboreum]